MGESRTQERLCSACTCNLENCTQSTHTRDQDILPDILVHCIYTWQRGDGFFSAAEHPLSSKSTGFRSEVQFILWILKKAWSMTTKCLQNERLPSSGGEQKKSMVIYHNMCEQTSSGKMINIYFQCILKRTPGLLCLITVLWIRDT